MKIKIILGALGILVVLLVVAALVIGTHLGSLVKVGMETIGPRVTQTTLTVDAVTVSLFAGSAGVTGLVLGNPEGYKAPSSIVVSNAAISLAPGSVLSDKIVIRSIRVQAPEITFEGNPLGANNLKKIMDNVDALAGPATPGGTNAAPAAPAGQKKPAKKLEVDDFLIAGAKVHANLTGLINQEISLTLPDIHLTGLGQGPEGITVEELTKEVLSEITKATITSVVNEAAKLGKGLTNAGKSLVGGVLQSSNNAIGDGVNKLKKGIGGLFGK